MIKVSGLWLNDSPKGKYFSGSIGGIKILVFKNTFKKEGSKEPDYEMYFDEYKKKETTVEQDLKEPFDDDIPF